MKATFIPSSSTVGHTGLVVRILLVEDDDSLATVVVRGLREDGYAVDQCGTVLDATHQMDVEDHDLVILDIGLPDGDGLSLCRAIRDSGSVIPVLLLTARDGLSDKVAGLDSGADDYLTKPFDYPELTARIRALLRRPAATRSPQLMVEDIRLDPASRTVWRGLITVPLTAREFALLQMLMSYPGDVVTREFLLDHVWDSNYDGLSNVVDVHVANLRRKLHVDGGVDPIETVRGVGYRMGAAAS